MTEKNTMAEVLEVVVNRAFEDIHTSMPGRFESYDFRTQKATVKPLLKKVYLDGTVLDLPVLGGVPVMFPRTGAAGITFPIKKGDKCLLLFTERAIERWVLSGENSEPGDRRRYDLSDAIAIPGLYSFAEKNIQSNNADVEIHNKDQKITIKSNGDIEIGAKDLFALINENFRSIFDNHVHNISVAGTPAAQTGVSSSPVSDLGPGPIAVPPIPTTLKVLGEAIPDSAVTSKARAE